MEKYNIPQQSKLQLSWMALFTLTLSGRLGVVNPIHSIPVRGGRGGQKQLFTTHRLDNSYINQACRWSVNLILSIMVAGRKLVLYVPQFNFGGSLKSKMSHFQIPNKSIEFELNIQILLWL